MKIFFPLFLKFSIRGKNITYSILFCLFISFFQRHFTSHKHMLPVLMQILHDDMKNDFFFLSRSYGVCTT